MNWHVLYTKSRCEKTVAEKLASLGFEVYCPVLKTKRKWSDRWKWVEEPLFRSYCFVNISNKDRENVLPTPGVVRYLYFCGKPAIVRQEEIDTLKNWLDQFSHDAISSSVYHPEDKVVLKSGVLINQSAEVLKTGGNFILLRLDGLGMEIKVDLRKNIVEKLES